MRSPGGCFLLNPSTFDGGMKEISGKPDSVIDYANPPVEYGKKRRG
ncbi:MAG: hypothetical protein QXQ46_10985 [Thermoplasmatales archaeon]